MKRKLVKQGANALTVTLPYKWVKQRSLNPGDEVLIDERDQELIIRGHGEQASRSIAIDVSALNQRTIRWFLSGLHKGGYDEIRIFYGSNAAAVPVIQEMVRELLLGFAVMEQTDTRCVLRMLAKDSSEEFEATLRRAFLVTLSMADSLLDLLRRKRFGEIQQLATLEMTNNQLTNFCQRILNKNLYEGDHRTHFLYVIAWNLEKIGDIYKLLCIDLSSTAKADAETVSMLGKITDHFRAYYELYYAFDPNRLSDLAERRKGIAAAIEATLRSGSKNAMPWAHMLSLLARCDDFSVSLFTLRHQAVA